MISEQENICAICGGIKTFYYQVDPVYQKHARLTSRPVTSFTLCPGHPEPKEKHNGKLDEQGKAEVWFTQGLSITPYVHISDQDEVVVLEAKQALSLLAWLRQEESRLKELAEKDRE